MVEEKPKPEHPLVNIFINVLIPVIVLGYLSKDPAIQEKLGKPVKPWHIGPLWSMIIALALPFGYGVWHFIKTRKANFMSGLGLASVALSGGLTLYLWNPDGTVKPNAGLLFGLTEGIIPLMLGFAVLGSQKNSTPMLRLFLYNDAIFDIPKIEKRISERSEEGRYQELLKDATRLFAGSFFLSAILNVAIALWAFRAFDSKAIDALEKYNGIVSTLKWAGFLAIGIPLLGIIFLILTRLLKGLREITGYNDDELMLPR